MLPHSGRFCFAPSWNPDGIQILQPVVAPKAFGATLGNRPPIPRPERGGVNAALLTSRRRFGRRGRWAPVEC